MTYQGQCLQAAVSEKWLDVDLWAPTGHEKGAMLGHGAEHTEHPPGRDDEVAPQALEG